MVESIREMKGKVTTERRYYLTSLTDLTTIADTIRNHWSIENSQHWVLDVIYGEDAQKSLERNEKANKALLTRTALNLIRANGDEKLSVKRCKMRASQNKSFLEQLLFGKSFASRQFAAAKAGRFLHKIQTTRQDLVIFDCELGSRMVWEWSSKKIIVHGVCYCPTHRQSPLATVNHDAMHQTGLMEILPMAQNGSDNGINWWSANIFLPSDGGKLVLAACFGLHWRQLPVIVGNCHSNH